MPKVIAYARAVLLSSILMVSGETWSGGFPATINTNNPFLSIQSGETGGACGNGDAVTCVTAPIGIATNKHYSYFIEVPAGTGELRLEIFDADAGVGGATETTAGRDGTATNRVFTYTLRDGSGAVRATRFDRGDGVSTLTGTLTGLRDGAAGPAVDCDPVSAGTQTSDNAWCPHFIGASPSAGHWELRIAAVSTSADDLKNYFGVRARDTVTSRDLNVYARSFSHFGNQTVAARLAFTRANGNNALYPWVTQACSIANYDFDEDNNASAFFRYRHDAAPTAAPADLTEAAGNLSANNVWNRDLLAAHATDAGGNRYGIWRFEQSQGTNGNDSTVMATSELNTLVSPTTQPSPGSYRFYLPQIDGSAPSKPRFRQNYNQISGPATPTVGSTSRIRVQLTVINSTPYPITFNASNLIAWTVPADVAANVDYGYVNPSFSTNCGSNVTQPLNSATGSVTWNPGVVAPALACKATFDIDVRPLSAGRKIVTGTTANGTTLNYLDETGRAEIVGPLCELAITTGSAVTPVTLAYASYTSTASGHQVEFASASEAGTLSYEIYAGSKDSPEKSVSEPIWAQNVGEPSPATYRAALRQAIDEYFWIAELDITGKRVFYGPFNRNIATGEKPIAVTADWRIAREEQATSAARLRLQTSKRALISSANEGWHRINHEDLLAVGVDYRGIPIEQLALTQRGQPIAIDVEGGPSFGVGSSIVFFAENADSIYDKSAHFSLEINPSKSLRIGSLYAAPGLEPALTAVNTIYDHEPNRFYAATAPGDAWYATELTRNGSADGLVHTESVPAQGLTAGAGETLEVVLAGGIDFEAVDEDHAVQISLNGQVLAIERFGGIGVYVAHVPLPPGLLRENNNAIALNLVAQTGTTVDRVKLEAIRLHYKKRLSREGWTSSASESAGGFDMRVFADGLEGGSPAASCAEAPNCQTYRLTGVGENEAIYARSENQLYRLQYVQRNGSEATFTMPERNPMHYLFRTQLHTPIVKAAASANALIDSHADLLVVAPRALADAVAPLIAARHAEGLQVALIHTESVFESLSDGARDPDAIKQVIKIAHQKFGTRYVLLVGGDTYDYHDRLALGSISHIPTWYRTTSAYVFHAPTDLPYVDINDDGLPELSIGRLPGRSSAHIQAQVEKLLRYATAPLANRSLFVSDRPSNGMDFAALSSEMSSAFASPVAPQTLQLASFETGAAGNAAAQSALIAHLNGGIAMLNYFGHSSPSSWTNTGLLNHTSLSASALANAQFPTLLTQWGCWGGYFVSPRNDALLHAWLTPSNKGAAAMIAASGLTSVDADSQAAALLLAKLRSGQRIGDAVNEALIELHGQNPNAIDITLGLQILGDPTMRLNRLN